MVLIIKIGLFMSNGFGLGIIMLWSLGFLVPYTFIGFIEILVIISFSIFLLNKIFKMKYVITKEKL